MEIEGQVLLQVKLTDGRILRRHIDQVRPRSATDGDGTPASDDGTEDGPLPGGNDIYPEEPEPTPPEPADTETQEPDREPTGESETEEPEMERTELETGTAEDSPDTSQTVRRSSRASQPPQRFGEQRFYFYFYFYFLVSSLMVMFDL